MSTTDPQIAAEMDQAWAEYAQLNESPAVGWEATEGWSSAPAAAEEGRAR
jgi:hypothetical protein